MRLFSTLLTLSALSLLAGCAADPVDGEATDSADLTAREGYTAITNDRGGVYVSVAASGKRAFLGDNRRGIDIVDLETMKKTGTIEGRIPSDSLSASGGLLAACGERDDQPLNWDAYYGRSDRKYVITILDAGTGEKKYEVALGLEQHLRSASGSGFSDVPDMTCQLDAAAKTLRVSFSKSNLTDEVVTFPLPDAEVTYDFRDIPGATRQEIAGGERNPVKDFSQSPRGLTFTAGGYGLRRVAPGASAPETIRDVDREHLVGVVERGAHLFVADHQNGLLVLDADSADEIASFAIDDYIHGVTLADGYVLVVGRQGLFVTKNRWSR